MPLFNMGRNLQRFSVFWSSDLDPYPIFPRETSSRSRYFQRQKVPSALRPLKFLKKVSPLFLVFLSQLFSTSPSSLLFDFFSDSDTVSYPLRLSQSTMHLIPLSRYSNLSSKDPERVPLAQSLLDLRRN